LDSSLDINAWILTVPTSLPTALAAPGLALEVRPGHAEQPMIQLDFDWVDRAGANVD
jgi:hypothetical protein